MNIFSGVTVDVIDDVAESDDVIGEVTIPTALFESGEPKSTTQGSRPISCRIPTAPWSRVTSYTFADIIIGGISKIGAPTVSGSLSGK